jgi:hypothetical protein
VVEVWVVVLGFKLDRLACWDPFITGFACVCICVRAGVCMCVCERETERETHTHTLTHTQAYTHTLSHTHTHTHTERERERERAGCYEFICEANVKGLRRISLSTDCFQDWVNVSLV